MISQCAFHLHIPDDYWGSAFYPQNPLQLIDDGLLERRVEKFSQASWERAVLDYKYLGTERGSLYAWCDFTILDLLGNYINKKKHELPKFWDLTPKKAGICFKQEKLASDLSVYLSYD